MIRHYCPDCARWALRESEMVETVTSPCSRCRELERALVLYAAMMGEERPPRSVSERALWASLNALQGHWERVAEENEG